MSLHWKTYFCSLRLDELDRERRYQENCGASEEFLKGFDAARNVIQAKYDDLATGWDPYKRWDLPR